MPFPNTPTLDDFGSPWDFLLPATFPAQFVHNRIENPMTAAGWNPAAPIDVPGLQCAGGVAFSSQIEGLASGSQWLTPMPLPLEVYVGVATWPAGASARVTLTITNRLADPTGMDPTSGYVDGYGIPMSNATNGQVTVRRWTTGQATAAAFPGQPVSDLGPFAAGDVIGASLGADGAIVVLRGRSGIWMQLVTVYDLSPLLDAALYVGMSTNAADTRFDSFGGGQYGEPPGPGTHTTLTPPALISGLV